mmetsp:Transcript_14657/g.21885  ORF Transcript_14657/g.21885 Transcript_14657/m.21885 type:complete len:244 (+) Transcript_14657:855-1586(+)
MNSGCGDDCLVASPQMNTGDAVIGGSDIDTLSLFQSTSGHTVSLETGVSSDGTNTYTVSTIEYLIGSEFTDVLMGSDVDETIVASNDASSNNDMIHAGDGDDSIDAHYMGTLPNNLAGNEGDDTMNVLGNGPNSLFGGISNDSIVSSTGQDTVWEDEGNDWIETSGINTVYGGPDDDTILIQPRGASDQQSLDGGEGNGSIIGAELAIDKSDSDTLDHNQLTKEDSFSTWCRCAHPLVNSKSL